MTIEPDDGSAGTLDTDNGDIATVSITESADGEQHTFTESWDCWQNALTFETSPKTALHRPAPELTNTLTRLLPEQISVCGRLSFKGL